MSFDDRTCIINDEALHDDTPLIVNTEQPYRPIRTTAFIVVHILFMVDIFQVAKFESFFSIFY